MEVSTRRVACVRRRKRQPSTPIWIRRRALGRRPDSMRASPLLARRGCLTNRRLRRYKLCAVDRGLLVAGSFEGHIFDLGDRPWLLRAGREFYRLRGRVAICRSRSLTRRPESPCPERIGIERKVWLGERPRCGSLVHRGKFVRLLRRQIRRSAVRTSATSGTSPSPRDSKPERS